MKTRNTARAVMLDPSHRVLLFEFHFPAGFLDDKPKQFWATPGGEIEPGESGLQALTREVLEETGIQNFTVGPELWFGTNFITLKGVRTQTLEQFFLVRSPTTEIVTTNWTDLEREVMRKHRWWKVEELISTGETIFPPRFGYLIEQVLRQGTAERIEIAL